LIAACSGNSKVDRSEQRGDEVADEAVSGKAQSGDGTTMEDSDEQGLRFRISESEPGSDDGETTRRIDGEPLGESEAKKLLSRLPPIEAEAADEKSFAFRDRSKPPPQTGDVESTPFPPAEQRDRPEADSDETSGPLEIERRSPVGDVDIAPRLSVTFSQTMVPVGETGKVADIDRPVDIAPQVDGEWRWVGTRTLLFEPDGGRFPMATDYEVAVRDDAESTAGTAFEEPPSWEFATPPVQVERAHPTGGPHPRDPLMFLEFDQRVEPDEIIEYVKLWGGGEKYEPRLVSDERVEDHETVRRLAEQAPDDQWIAFSPQANLRADAEFQFGLEQGVPSAEGERTTAEGQFETFSTYSALQVEKTRCQTENCRPGEAWTIQFNNPLDPESVDRSSVSIDPKLPGKEVAVRHDRIIVRGNSRGQRTYTLQLSEEIEDGFGQRLGGTEPLDVEVGAARTVVYGGGQQKVTLDPTGPPSFPVHSINYEELEVRALAVEPSDWKSYLQAVWDKDTELPGEEVFTREIEVDADRDTFGTTQVDLEEALGDGGNHVVLDVQGRGARSERGTRQPRHRQGFQVWVQATDIGLDAYVDNQTMIAWATSLAEGEPLEGVEVSFATDSASATTDADGVARLELPSEGGASMLVAEQGEDRVFLPRSTHWSGRSGWQRREPRTEGRWFVFDDRNLYRPGESMRLKGWLRVTDDEDLAIPKDGTMVAYRVVGPRRNEIASGTAETYAHGGFDLTVEMPDDVNLGAAHVELETTVDGRDLSERHTFQIQEFRTPSFEVGVEGKSAGPHLVGETLRVGSESDYYTGGAVRGAEVDWLLESNATSYQPPGWSEFVFGGRDPWWFGGPGGGDASRSESFTGETDGTGEHGIAVDLEGVSPPEPQSLTASATVTDVDRQTISGSREFLVHPSEMYVGLKTDRWFVEADEPLPVEVVAARIDGSPVAGRSITVRAERLEWRRTDDGWTEKPAETTDCEIETGEDPVTCELEFEKGGQWRITATIEDEQGRKNRTRMRTWVAGGEQPRSEKLEREELQLVPRRDSFEPGQTAEVLVQAPFAGGQGLAVLTRGEVEKTIPFSMEGTSHRLEIPIEEADIPNLNVRVDLNGSVPRKSDDGGEAGDVPERPAFASGELELPVSRESKSLGVEVTPSEDEVRPGSELEVDLEVSDASGSPVSNARVALVVVDEAILAAADYQLGDPLERFFPEHASGLETHHLRETVVLATLEQLRSDDELGALEMEDAAGASDMEEAFAKQEMALGGAEKGGLGSAGGGGGGEPIDLRKDFRPLAHFAPALETDSEGRASANFELPDNLTRYRLMAVAVHEADRVGSGEAQVTARLPLMVQPSMPRFLNWGDRAELPVVVRNQTGDSRQVRLAARANNLKMERARGYRFEVPANDRVELRFPAETLSPGRARLQFATASGDWADAATADFPVWTPATTEAFADYGTLDEGDGPISRQIQVPDDAIGSFGALEVTTSSTALEQLTDAFLYLVDYPYDCSEQIASRLLSVAALRDVLAAFDAEGLPDGDELDEMVRRDVERLASLQTAGGFAMWRSRGRTRPFPSVHAAHALTVADSHGIDVPTRVLERARIYLRDIRQYLPSDWSPQVRNTIRAYALYVLNEMGSPEPGETEKLAQKSVGEELPLEAAGWLLATLADQPSESDAQKELRQAIDNRAVEEAGTAQFTTEYGNDQGHVVMHSNRRSDAVILDALLRSTPDSSLVPKVVEGLMAHRTKGRWSNTQENVFVLLALRQYFDTFEEESPDFAARMWLGDEYLGEHEYRERTTDNRRVEVPVSAVREVSENSEGGKADLTVSREGSGRMYYRIGLRYAPESLDLEARERGFAVERTYEPVDADDDVQKTEDGTWQIEAGSRVRVRLRMVAPARRHHVALVDPLAGGFESLNPAIATAEPVPEDPKDDADGAQWWWHRPWFEHQNLRDERTEAFASTVGAGVHEYTYVVRATTPGEFVVPPPKAEEMYHPETFGRGGTDRVIVE
jgi:uncharacterized protein YfaS (alpha-2-macroglobulin family)